MILGVDFGLKNVGLATSDGYIAQPFAVVKTKDSKSAVAQIKQKIQGLVLSTIVVGISEGKSKDQAMAFGKKLGTVLELPVFYEDETLSSFEAGPKNHAKAAAFILQRFLDNNPKVLNN